MRIVKLILKWTLITFGVLVGLAFLIGGSSFLVEIPFKLAFGWIGFLSGNLEAMEPNWLLIAEAAACAIAFGIGGHYFARWLWSAMAPAGSGAWRAGWSVATAGGVLLLFVAGIATVGITHQTVWLSTAKGPFLVDSFTDRARVTEALAIAAGAKTAVGEFFERTGRLPQSAAEAGVGLNTPNGRFVRSLNIDPGGIVRIEISEQVGGGGTISLAPTPKGAALDWKCSATLDRMLLPSACRD